MIALASAMAAFRRLPRLFWIAGFAVLVILLAWRWHLGKVEAAFVAGASEQARLDEGQVREAMAAAVLAQRTLKSTLEKQQASISKGTKDALLAKQGDLVRRYDDLRLRWAAHRADQGRAGQDGAAGLSDSAGGADDAACAAAGWVSFDTAAAAAQAADTAIARDDAWRHWVTAQAEAWPE